MGLTVSPRSASSLRSGQSHTKTIGELKWREPPPLTHGVLERAMHNAKDVLPTLRTATSHPSSTRKKREAG
jgi:hypothetical protein